MLGSGAFPNLPGYTPAHDPTVTPIQRVAHHRVSANKQELNRDYVSFTQANRPIPQYVLPRRERQSEPDQSRMFNANFMSTTHSVHAPMGTQEITEQFEPTFVKLDRQVLRFHGYFRESVVESRMEHYRITKLIIYYYLEDHTISIIEPRQMNSGKPQGSFLKRRMVLKEDNSGICILPTDL